MQLRHLRYFVAVTETQNLSRAAAKLHVAQPAMSRQINDLERTLHVPLFVRHPKGVALTTAGEALAQAAPQILADLAAAIDRAEAIAAGRRGLVVLGSMRAFVARGFPATVQEELRREHPEITLVLQDLDPPDLIEHLHDGSVDLALTLDDPFDSTLAVASLWEDALDRALVPAGHQLAKRRSVMVSDLGDLPLVVARRGSSAQRLEDALETLRANGLRSPVVVVDAGLQAAHMAVAAGRGWTMITGVRARALPEGTAAVPVKGIGLRVGAAVAWRRAEHRPVVRTVLEKVLEVARREPAHRVAAETVNLPRATGSRRRRQPGTVPQSLELRHLRALVAVAATQTIGRAAEQLGVTQPSVSRQLKELEHDVGVPLLERSARG
ncbi:MAG: LysR family transcriptional regulator, partial [Gemmatimonadaceae bacterium]